MKKTELPIRIFNLSDIKLQLGEFLWWMGDKISIYLLVLLGEKMCI